MDARHTLHATQRHAGWDNSLPPVVTIEPGDSVELSCLDASGGQLGPASTSASLGALDLDLVNPTTGPIAVDGAEPGDALLVRIDDITVSGHWGWTALIPGFGLLADDFPDPILLQWLLEDDATVAELPGGGAQVPLSPMVGTIGVAPAAPGRHSQIPPRHVGGNLDTREIRAGTVLRLPVEVPGALLSIGDLHAAQGDGEVCGTGLEVPATVSVTVGVEQGAAPPTPMYQTNGPPRGAEVADGVIATTGVREDLMSATRDATRAMIDHLGAVAGLDPAHAYALCSVAADLAITEVVDAPNWVVALRLPRHVIS